MPRRDRSAIWVVRGHQTPETTGTEVAFCSFTSGCAAIAPVAEWSSISAARRSLGPTSGSWERCWSTRAPPNTASACISRSRPLQRTRTRCEVGSGFGSSRRCMWSRGCSAPEFVEECKTSSTGARSGRPGEPVRAIRCQGSKEVGGARRGEGSSGFRVAKVDSQDCEWQPQWPGMRLFHSQFNQTREYKLLIWRRW